MHDTLDLRAWLDAIYAVWMEAPHELLEKAARQLEMHAVRARPDEARETWGRSAEQQEQNRRLLESAPVMPTVPVGPPRPLPPP